MKKDKKREKTAEATVFHKVLTRLGSFTRLQILGTLTVFAGIILIAFLLPGDEAPPQENTSTAKNIPAQGAEERVSREESALPTATNRPPVLTSIALSPNIVLPGVPVRVEVKSNDPDQDDVRFNFTWKINGQTEAGQSGEVFDTSELRKGDLITVTVIPDDGKDQGKPLESNGVIIQNRPPEILSLPAAGISSGYFQYQVTAKDADNDPLLFSLEGGPAEMTIDSTGLIQWTVPRGLMGKEQVRVIVSDGSSSSFQVFNLNLGSGVAQ